MIDVYYNAYYKKWSVVTQLPTGRESVGNSNATKAEAELEATRLRKLRVEIQEYEFNHRIGKSLR